MAARCKTRLGPGGACWREAEHGCWLCAVGALIMRKRNLAQAAEKVNADLAKHRFMREKSGRGSGGCAAAAL